MTETAKAEELEPASARSVLSWERLSGFEKVVELALNSTVLEKGRRLKSSQLVA